MTETLEYGYISELPLPLQIQALSQKLILTSISEDVSARVQAFELG